MTDLIKRLRLFVCILWGITHPVQAGIHVWLPDTSVSQQSEIRIPLYVSSVSTADSIVAYDCNFEYDQRFLTLLTVDQHGGMTGPWGAPYIRSGSGEAHVAAFTSNLSESQMVDTTRIWFSIVFRVESDTTRLTEIRLTHFQLFPLHGQIPTDSMTSARLCIEVNFAPIVQTFPGYHMLEDDSVSVLLTDYIHDPNDPWSRLTLQFTGDDHVATRIDSAGLLMIKPENNWSGNAELGIHVTDSFGSSAEGVMMIHVIPVPDPPQPFDLIKPPCDADIEENSGFLNFEWEASFDPDADEEVKYRLYLGPDSTFQSPETMLFSNLSSPGLSYFQTLSPGIYYWKVISEDNSGFYQQSDHVFRFEVKPVTDVRESMDPEEYGLFGNYPNPFNQNTHIPFFLPVPGQIKLDIMDIRGKRIRRLTSRMTEAGPHELIWDGYDEEGRAAASGHYWIVMSVSGKTWTRKMCLLK
ncbi:hypothetical protein JW948_04995 [bacterium]|nr:hypothetical protein [bacterium]